MKSFTVTKQEDGKRLSRFVLSVTEKLPASMLYKGLRNKRIKVNGKRAEANTCLHEGDKVELYLNDEFFAAEKAEKPAKKLPLPTVIYEDENICILYKPAHVLCHSDRTGDISLVEMLHAYLRQKGEYCPEQENSFTPALCNRLDRGTEGLTVAAKNYAALRDMNAVIRDNLLQKQYYCITVGTPPQGRFTAYLQHREKDNKVAVRAAAAEGYKEIITEVAVLQQRGAFALCRIGLITGRTHQIRAHLAFLGAPVLGDIKYGNRKVNEQRGFRTQALCAAQITFADIPPESSLQYLSRRTVTLEKPHILQQFEKL